MVYNIKEYIIFKVIQLYVFVNPLLFRKSREICVFQLKKPPFLKVLMAIGFYDNKNIGYILGLN
jgi:hypothetical protein